MPKVSIIIPSYNHAKFLEKRLDSIFNQTYQDFEVIFLDDASSDNTKEVFAKYSEHPKLKKAIFNSQNSGSPFKQWNKGVKEAEGEYIWIAESDDYAELNFLETLVPILEKNDKLGITYCQSLQVDAKGKVAKSYADYTKNLNPDRWDKDFIGIGQDEVVNYLIVQNTIPNASAVVMRRDAYIEAGMVPENMRLCGDWYCYITILKNYNIGFCSQPLNYYRVHPQVTRRYSRKDKSKYLIRYLENYRILNFVLDNFQVIPDKKEFVYFTLINKWSNVISLLDCFRLNFWKLIYYHLKAQPSQFSRLIRVKPMLINILENSKFDLKETLKIILISIKFNSQRKSS